MFEKNFLFAASEGYVKFCAVSITSIIDHHLNEKLRFHILTDSISKQSFKVLKNICQKANADLCIYNVDEKYLKTLEAYRGKRYTWYRILFDLYLDLNRIIEKGHGLLLYLDTDIIINGSLNKLFDIDLKDKSLAAVPDICCNPKRYEHLQIKNYFNAGVLLINVQYWKENHLYEKILEWGCKELKSEDEDMPDQDALNVVCNTSKALLPIKYNYLIWFQNYYKTSFLRYNPEFETSIKEGTKDLTIIHFATANPWHHFASDIINSNTINAVQLWYKYAFIVDKQYFKKVFYQTIMNTFIITFKKLLKGHKYGR